MEISGKEKFDLSKEEVWNVLHDPEISKRVIPGCEELIMIDEGLYEVVMNLGVAAVKGRYTGRINLQIVEKPINYILVAEGSGSPGHVSAEMDCSLEDLPSGGSKLTWDCKAEVGGLIASVGSRVLGGIAKFMAGKFFSDIKKQIKLTTK